MASVSCSSDTVSSYTIQKDFIKDYGELLIQNGFVRRNKVFYRVHGNDVLLYVRLCFFAGDWTIVFAAHEFSFGYKDIKGYDGIRLSDDYLRPRYLEQNIVQGLDFYDRSPDNYQYLRKLCHTAFFDEIFPRFNNITSIDTWIEFYNWFRALTDDRIGYNELAELSFQQYDYQQGALYLEKYLMHYNERYNKAILVGPNAFTKRYEMYNCFLSDINAGCTANIDSYINEKVAITVNTCAALKLI